jgi:NTE family protein
MSRRRGVVLGAGGFLGAAWMLGALAAVQDATGWDTRNADQLVGTSAGSVLTALLRSGVSVNELYDAHNAEKVTERLTALPDAPAPTLRLDLRDEPCWPGLPQLGLGSVPLVMRAARSPLRLRPGALCAGLLPRGRRSLARIQSMIDGAGPISGWPNGTWVVAMNYHTGARVAFGREGSPTASISRAVMASCAVPAWYAPIRIEQVPYVDGGVCSPYNADLLIGEELDEVFVLAPMASLEPDRPRTPLIWLERLWRRAATKRLHRELSALRASGTQVTVLAPNATDLEVMGANMMDPARSHEVMRSARGSVSARLAAGPAVDEVLTDAA